MSNPDATQLIHLLPDLPYPVGALEPHIDARTMTLHHGKHHASYVANLNAALVKVPELRVHTATWMLVNPDAIPEEARAAIGNNAGGHINHSMFWRSMTPGGSSGPTGALADAIKRDFGDVEKFKALFNAAGEKVFGGGWVWLVRTQQDGGRLEVLTTTGHGNPLTQGHSPILLNDVWEHAYYLKYENRRADYLKNWWAIVDWKEAARRFESSALSPARRPESDDRLLLQEPA